MSEDDRSRPKNIASLDAAREAVAQRARAGENAANERAANENAANEASSRLPESRDEETHNPLALILGLVVVAILVIGSWLLIQNMRCNPLFSDAGLAHSRACQ